MLRRPSRTTFAAGAMVFPGGVVDGTDAGLPESHTQGASLTAAAARMHLDPAAARGYHVAALRELFEEAGVLIGSAPRGGLEEARSALLRGEELAAVLQRHGLCLALDALTYIAHFVTPRGQPRRYDTRFFLSEVSAQEQAATHAAEAVHGGWYTPAAVLRLAAEEPALLLPPTRILLAELAQHTTVRSAREDLGTRAVVQVRFDLDDVRAGRVPHLLPR